MNDRKFILKKIKCFLSFHEVDKSTITDMSFVKKCIIQKKSLYGGICKNCNQVVCVSYDGRDFQINKD